MLDKKAKTRQEEYRKKWDENKAKGLTGPGYTKTFDGEELTFYLNNVAITCKVDYNIGGPHLEFRGEPTLLTETGYRSHFMNGDLNRYDSLKDCIVESVEYIIRDRYCQNSKAEYTLTWEPSLDYLRHSPKQLTFLPA